MNKVIVLFVLVLIFVVGGAYLASTSNINSPMSSVGSVYATDYKNGTYEIFGTQTTLKDGLSEVKISPDSDSVATTRYFGNESRGDLNGDGVEDVAFILTENGGGSGTFYLVAVALGSEKGYLGTNAVLIGDRIAPQTTEIRDGELIVNYADRRPDEPMSARPSIGASLYLKVADGRLVKSR